MCMHTNEQTMGRLADWNLMNMLSHVRICNNHHKTVLDFLGFLLSICDRYRHCCSKFSFSFIAHVVTTLPNRDNIRSSADTQVHQWEMVTQNRTLSVVQHLDIRWNFIVLLNFIYHIHDNSSNVRDNYSGRGWPQWRETQISYSQLQRTFSYWNNLKNIHKQ